MRLALLLCLAGAISAFALEPPPPYFEDAVQDGKGDLWAYSRAEYNRIYRFDGTQWSELGGPFDSGDNAMPAKVVKMADGTVACIWRLGNHRVGISLQTGNDVSLLGTCPGEIPSSGLTVTPLADSKNRLWITEQFPAIYLADGKGGVKMVHEIKPEELDSPNKTREGYNKIHAVEDGHGRVWIWSDPNASNWANLRGILIFTDETPELHESFPGLKPGARILTFARADDRHMWMTVADDGIYRVDIDSFALERLPDPAPKALCCVHELFVNGGDVYAVEDKPAFLRELWRLRNGEWKLIIPQFDQGNSWLPRSWLPIKEGLLVQSSLKNLWFIPTDGEPASFSWRTGFSFGNVHSLARFADGSFFAIGNNSHFLHGPLSLPPKEQDNPRITQLEGEQGWTLAAGRPWMLFKNPVPSLSEWDGEKWIAHPLPSDIGKSNPGILADEEGRLWVLWGAEKQRIQILTIKTNQWQIFPELQDAYIGLRKKPPHFAENDVFTFDPQYSADGKRIAYREGVTELHYYDGKAWQKLKRPQITDKKDSDGAIGPPWFDANGKLCINIRNKTSWQQDNTGKWTSIPFQSHWPTDIWSEGQNRPGRPIPPDGCVTNHPDSIIMDNLGTCWLSWQGDLYKAIPGRCVKVFGPDELNPFRSIHDLRKAFVDPRGNAFLLTASSRMGVFIIKPNSPQPQVTITLGAIDRDSVKAELHTNSTSPVHFRWQLDAAPWQATDDAALSLEGLPNGTHKLTVSALTDDLLPEAKPAVATFKIKVDPRRQLADLIKKLSDPDYEQRKSAVNALALQPATAVPALRKARAAADDDKRWWIDATLQKIEMLQKASPKKPGEAPAK